jgi:hypothetical protein
VTVPYSEEYRVRETNQALIQALASTEPSGGQSGLVTPPLDLVPTEELLDSNAFRGGLALARSIRDAWPWFVLAGCCLFLGDVFVRRVAINLNWIGAALKRIRGDSSDKDSVVTARLDALKKNKESLDDSLQRRRSSVRFEPTEIDAQHESVELSDRPVSAAEKPKPSAESDQSEGPSYTERLLEAKRRARKK